MSRFRLTLAQLDPTVGDIDGNAEKARAAWRAGRDAGADLVALTEMFVTGYPVQDLVLKTAFRDHAMRAIAQLARDCADGPALAIGGPCAYGGRLHNAYWILQGGEVRARFLKHRLSNQRVFDEERVFDAGEIHGPVMIGPVRVGCPICQDGWTEDVAEAMAESGAQILLVPNGSPYFRGKLDVRLGHMVARTVETGLPVVYLNMVGGQDGLVFDGSSFVLNPHGELAVQLPPLEEAVVHVDFVEDAGGWRAEPGPRVARPDDWELDYHVMVTALRDYVGKSGVESVLLGLSGDLDSALVAAIAVDAFGPERVRGVMLSSEDTSAASRGNVAAVAEALGCRFDEIAIDAPYAAMAATLAPVFGGVPHGLAEQNLWSRLRGVVLRGLADEFGAMLVIADNKSRLAISQTSLHGDMAGGYNPIKDLYGTRVFETCRWRNANWRNWMMGPRGEVVPTRIIDEASGAELRTGAAEEDRLPHHDVLDRILEQLVDREASVAEVVAMGHDRAIVKKIEELIYTSECKRFQSAPGTRLTPHSFWLDRRYPVVNRWRDPS